MAVRVDFTRVPKFNPLRIRSDLENLSDTELAILLFKLQWRATARRKQLPPEGEWTTWGLRSGRGFGKTLTAAHWMAECALDDPGSINHVVAPTYDDARYTCFEGPTGLMSIIPPRFIYDANKALPSLTLTNGSYFRGFAANTPDRLRGPQCHRIWAEEIATWLYPKEAWSNIEFGLRLGKNPQMAWTSTPRPTPFMKERIEDPNAIVILGTTYENRENLTKLFYQNIAKYEGTAIGRQELLGELLDPEEGGFVKRSQIKLWPANTPLPKFRFLILSLDTAFTEETYDKKKNESDYTAGSVWGLFEYNGLLHVMLLDCWEDRLGYPNLIKRVKKEMEKTYGDYDEPLLISLSRSGDRPGHTGRKPDVILIESKGSGISLRQSMAAENILTESYNPGKLDKLSRLHIVSPMFAHRRVWTIESAHHRGRPATWAEPIITQFCTFVGEGSIEHDDLLDTGTQALRLMIDKFFSAFTVKVDPDELARVRARAELARRMKVNPYG